MIYCTLTNLWPNLGLKISLSDSQMAFYDSELIECISTAIIGSGHFQVFNH